MIQSALRTYRSALNGGDVTTAQQRAAEGVLRAAKLIGDNARTPEKKRKIEVNFGMPKGGQDE